MNISNRSAFTHSIQFGRSRLQVLLFALLCALATNIEATTVIAPGFPQMVARAERIVTAKVSATRSQWAMRNGHRCIIKTVSFDVQQTHKGTVDKRLELEFLGGTVGSDTMDVKGVPTFQTGERVLLFSENNGKQFCPLVGIYHGKLIVERDPRTGADVVLRHNRQPIRSASDAGSDTPLRLSAAAAPAPTTGSMPLREFVAALEQELSKGGRR